MTTEQANLAPTCVNHPKVETRLAVAVVAGLIMLLVSFASLLLAAAHGFLVGAAVRWAARRRTHARLGLVAAAAVVVGLGGLVLLLGGNPLGARLLLAYAISGGIAYLRASGAW